MRILMSTEKLPEAKKFLYWRDFICDYYHQTEIFRTSDRSFNAEISETRFGDLTLSVVRACAHKASNMKCRMPQSHKRSVFLLQQLSGTASFSQDQRRAKLCPNDIICFDNTRPVSSTADGYYEQLLLHVPYDLWDRRFGCSEKVTARVLRADTGMGRMLGNYFREIPSVNKSGNPIAIYRLEDATLSLIAAAFCGLISKPEPGKSAGRMALLSRAKMFIESNLHDPGLNRKKVAAVLGISTCYLQALFRDENQSVNNWIWEMRLEKCRRDIADSMLSEKSLSEIAFANGFNSFPHFSRKFKDVFKMTASEYRHRHQGDAG